MTPPAQLGASTVNPAATSAAARPYRQVIHLSCTFFYPPTIVQKKRLFDLKQKSQEIAFMPKDQDAQRRFCLWPLYWKPPPHLVDLNSGIFFFGWRRCSRKCETSPLNWEATYYVGTSRKFPKAQFNWAFGGFLGGGDGSFRDPSRGAYLLIVPVSLNWALHLSGKYRGYSS